MGLFNFKRKQEIPKIYVKFKGNIYETPTGAIGVGEFKNFIRENVIDLDAVDFLELEQRCMVKNRYLDFLHASFMSSLMARAETDETIKEAFMDFCCNKINVISPKINFLLTRGDLELALVQIDKLIEEMLKFFNEMSFAKMR